MTELVNQDIFYTQDLLPHDCWAQLGMRGRLPADGTVLSVRKQNLPRDPWLVSTPELRRTGAKEASAFQPPSPVQHAPSADTHHVQGTHPSPSRLPTACPCHLSSHPHPGPESIQIHSLYPRHPSLTVQPHRGASGDREEAGPERSAPAPLGWTHSTRAPPLSPASEEPGLSQLTPTPTDGASRAGDRRIGCFKGKNSVPAAAGFQRKEGSPEATRDDRGACLSTYWGTHVYLPLN